MNDDIAIELKEVSKKYKLHHEKPTFVENIFSRNKSEQFWPLTNINIAVKKGERLGVIGLNGSGKTTLLEIIGGITTPTMGTVQTVGKLVSLIGLEAGFHPELTGEENVFLNGLLLGMGKNDIKSKFSKIVSFSGIKKFMDSPLYTYSDGMKLRLGFSIIVHTNPDILLLDENIYIGDQEFMIKAFKKIHDFMNSGKTIIMVSHFMDFIKSNCTRTLWIEKGRIKMDGPTNKVVSHYLNSIKRK